MKKIIQENLFDLNKITQDELGMFRGLRKDLLKDKSYGWSVIQVFSHLELSERASLNYMQKKILAGDKMHATSFANAMKMNLTKLALLSPLKWKAPSYVSNPPDDFTLEEIQNQWMETRNQIALFVEAYPEKYLNKAVYKHPMAGRLNLHDAIDSFRYHFLHHKHQLQRIKNCIL